MATKLTVDWLKNNVDYDMPGGDVFQKVKFDEYYLIACAYIREHFYLKPTTDQIEEYLEHGEYRYDSKTVAKCPIKDKDERIRLFLSAQAKQLIYDFTNGRGAMTRGEDSRYNICTDFVDRIKLLGLYQRTLYAI